jgi:GTPase KRas protein
LHYQHPVPRRLPHNPTNPPSLIEHSLTSLSSIEGRQLAESFGCTFIETSAKSRINVDNAFYDIVREIRKYNKDMSGYPSGGANHGNGGRNGPKDEMGFQDQEREAGCCGKCVVM